MTDKEIIHRKIYHHLKTLNPESIRLALVDIANQGPITRKQLAEMNYEKLQIAEKFYHLHWSRIIDFGFLDDSDGAESITVINPIRYSKRDAFGKEVAKLKRKIKLERDARRLGRKRVKDDSSSQSSDTEDPLKQVYPPAVYLWAGFLPPGK